MKKKITGIAGKGIFILFILICFHFQKAYALDVNGVISQDTRWTKEDSPINITGDVHVGVNTTLTIDPGVEVIFKSSPDIAQGYSIRINGTLIARGETNRPIIFTAADRAIPWGAIIFADDSKDWDQDSSSGNVIEHCLLEYGGNEPDGAGMIITFNAMPLIARNAIRFSVASGISALVSEDPALISSLSGNIRIISNQIYNNETGIRFLSEGGIIKNNYFLFNNQAINLQIRSNDVQIVNNTIISSAPELFGTGAHLLFDEKSNGIASYQWKQTGGQPVALTNPNTARPEFIAPDPGSKKEILTFKLTVTNKNGQKSEESIEITVIGSNPPPTAMAGADQNVQLPLEEDQEVTVTLDGSGSTDPYLGIARYLWKQTEGIAVELRNPRSISPTFTVPESVSAGDRMTFELTVTDQEGLKSTDKIDIIFYDNNIFPVSVAGEDRTVSQGEGVTLDGSGSNDPDGSISAFMWVQTEGTPVNLIQSNTAMPYFDAPEGSTTPQKLTFRLQVTDNSGLIAADDISVTVNSTLIADPGDDQTVSAWDSVILDGSDSLDQNATAHVDIELNNLEMDNADAGLIAFTADENASFTLNVTHNNFSAVNNEGYLVYAYRWLNGLPATVLMPDNWWGSDDPLIIENMIYDQTDNYQLPEVEYRPFAVKYISGTGSSLPYPPLADAGPDLTVDADHSVTLDGSRSYDPDGTARFQWKQVLGPAVNLKNASQPTASFVAPSGGADGVNLQFKLTVSTGNTFSHTDTVDVSVNPEGDLSTVDVGGCFIQTAGSDFFSNSFRVILNACILICLLLTWRLISETMSCRTRSGIQFFSGFQVKPGMTILRYLIVGLIGMLCSRKYCKFFTAFILMIVLMVLLAAPAQSAYFSVGGGAGGDADEVNVTLETGAKDINVQNQDLLFGVGIFLIPHSDNELPSSTISFPCPNNDCEELDSVRKGTEVGLLGKLGIEIGTSDVYVSAIGGFTSYTESKLSRSPATGRVYEDSSDSKIEALFGGGASYFIHYKLDMVFQVDYDTIRGVTGTIGLHW